MHSRATRWMWFHQQLWRSLAETSDLIFNCLRINYTVMNELYDCSFWIFLTIADSPHASLGRLYYPNQHCPHMLGNKRHWWLELLQDLLKFVGDKQKKKKQISNRKFTLKWNHCLHENTLDGAVRLAVNEKREKETNGSNILYVNER